MRAQVITSLIIFPLFLGKFYMEFTAKVVSLSLANFLLLPVIMAVLLASHAIVNIFTEKQWSEFLQISSRHEKFQRKEVQPEHFNSNIIVRSSDSSEKYFDKKGSLFVLTTEFDRFYHPLVLSNNFSKENLQRISFLAKWHLKFLETLEVIVLSMAFLSRLNSRLTSFGDQYSLFSDFVVQSKPEIHRVKQ